MPNWCMNNLMMTGPKDLLDNIADTKLSLSKLVPWPSELEGKQKIYPVPEEQEAEREALIAKYGSYNLYDWCISNWGTKWDIGPVEGINIFSIYEQGDIYQLEASFDSAWAPPVDAMRTIYEQYKHLGLNIFMEYFEPGCAFLGVVDTEGGEFKDDCRDYSNADELEEYARDLDNNLALMEIDYLREQEEEQREAAERAEVAEGTAQPEPKKKPAKKATAKKAPAKKPAKAAAKKPAKKPSVKKPAKKG